jgi:hypothetical protein
MIVHDRIHLLIENERREQVHICDPVVGFFVARVAVRWADKLWHRSAKRGRKDSAVKREWNFFVGETDSATCEAKEKGEAIR